jgi:hypothetical protein
MSLRCRIAGGIKRSRGGCHADRQAPAQRELERAFWVRTSKGTTTVMPRGSRRVRADRIEVVRERGGMGRELPSPGLSNLNREKFAGVVQR